MNKSFLIDLMDSLTNSTQLTWTRLQLADEVLVQMKSQMTTTHLIILTMTMSIVTYIVAYLLKELYLLLTMKSLKDKVVLITGGAGGIGKLIAKRCVNLGSTVVIWDINEELLQKTVREIETLHPGKVFGYQVDITNYNKVYEVAEKVRKDVGSGVDVLINNAGIVIGKSLLTATEKEISLTLNVNTLALFWTTRAFLPDMMRKKEGHIVTVASACGIAATSGMPDYCTSKFAAVGFNESMRVELKQNPDTWNIRTLCVCPYYINTGMFTGVQNGMLPLLEPDYVADRIVSSIQRREEMLILPWICKTSYFWKFFVPVWLQDVGLDILGVTRSMKTFKGRVATSKEA